MTIDDIRALHERGVAMFSREQVALLLREVESLEKQLACAYAFHKVAVAERNAERARPYAMCVECGQPTMHMGNACYACLHKALDNCSSQVA